MFQNNCNRVFHLLEHANVGCSISLQVRYDKFSELTPKGYTSRSTLLHAGLHFEACFLVWMLFVTHLGPQRTCAQAFGMLPTPVVGTCRSTSTRWVWTCVDDNQQRYIEAMASNHKGMASNLEEKLRISSNLY